jgi:hypothetical protein
VSEWSYREAQLGVFQSTLPPRPARFRHSSDELEIPAPPVRWLHARVRCCTYHSSVEVAVWVSIGLVCSCLRYPSRNRPRSVPVPAGVLGMATLHPRTPPPLRSMRSSAGRC